MTWGHVHSFWQIGTEALCQEDLLYQETILELSQFGNLEEEVVCQSEESVSPSRLLALSPPLPQPRTNPAPLPLECTRDRSLWSDAPHRSGQGGRGKVGGLGQRMY